MTITGSEKQNASLSPSYTSIPARKRTPTACKTWKEKLRLACLDRARRRRRHDHLNDSNDHEGDEMDGDILPPARALLEEELRQQGITVISPCINMDSRFEQQQQQQQMMNTDSCSSPSRDVSNNDSGVTDDNNNAIHANHYISEEELFELLQEVEEEMQRGEEEIDQLLAHERELELEQQVQEFEQQQEQEAALSEPKSWNNIVPLATRAVLCPICKEANLSETMLGGLVCPNHIHGSCPFELRAGHAQRQHGLTLTRLCQQLRRAYEQHAKHCHDFLSFEVSTAAVTNNDMMIHTEQQQQQQQQGQAENTILVAVCPACETRMQLV
jgi:hypothetical protein